VNDPVEGTAGQEENVVGVGVGVGAGVGVGVLLTLPPPQAVNRSDDALIAEKNLIFLCFT
jgi:hypothetical protein